MDSHDDYQIEVFVEQQNHNLLKVVGFYVIYQPTVWKWDLFSALMQVIEVSPFTTRIVWGNFIVKVTLNQTTLN